MLFPAATQEMERERGGGVV